MLTDSYPYFKFEFERFNPVQVSCLPYYDKDCNLVVSADTASGKTCVAAMAIGYHLAQGSGNIFYSSPLTSISSQMRSDWSKIPLLKNNLADDSGGRLHIATIERIDVMARKKDKALLDAACLILDEAHLIGDESRGAGAEAMAMAVTELAPSARVILLSGTMGNARQVAGWLKLLNGKPTYSVSSTWRPCALEKEVKPYKSYKDLEENTLQIIMDNAYDKILVFVHGKKQGRTLAKFLLGEGVQCGFFSADLSPSKAAAMLKRFKDQGSGMDTLVATSSLGMGVNL